MAIFSTRHKGREQVFGFKSFDYGLDKETSPVNLPITALTLCKNMKYKFNSNIAGEKTVVLMKRQGTKKITSSAIGSPVLACTYYLAGSQYVIATKSTAYYLDANMAPQTIGTIDGLPTFTEFHGKLIIHDGGVTKAWNGTTFETLNCLYEDEVIETGNNVLVDFTGTLLHPVIKTSSLTIIYTDGTNKTITDDGAGNLTGDCTAGTINYTTGAYSFTCTGAPDNTTSVYATYEMVAGAPKSKAGFVRASRLYMWGNADYPSRLHYCGPNDEDAWDSTSNGGYLDVDPLDGQDLIGCLNFFASIVAVKENRIHRIDNFPGDTTFRVEPLKDNLGSMAYRTVLTAGEISVFLSKEGFSTISATDKYGDVQKGPDLSERFRADAVAYATTSCYADYNQQDKQIWLTLSYNTELNVPEIYVINLETGGQLSMYDFAFSHSCYKYVNNEMLIGGADGNLYSLYPDEQCYFDNSVAYTTDTFVRGVMTNFGGYFSRVHNKKLYPHLYGKGGATATLKIYKDQEYNTAWLSESLVTTGGDALIYADQTTKIFVDTDKIGKEFISGTTEQLDRKFNYREVCFELASVTGPLGAEWHGMDLAGAILGFHQES
jgi:hypothetical protein